MMCINPNLDLINTDAYTKFVEILSICSQDTEWKGNKRDGQTGRMTDGMTDNPKPVYI